MEGCLVCGQELEYGQLTHTTCAVCGAEQTTEVQCQDGHYICDHCHQSDAIPFLERYISQTTLEDPVAMIKQIWRHPAFHMHGPEHHYLIPAIVLRALENSGVSVPQGYWRLIKQRASQLPGGTCGYWGACSAGISTGITASILAECSPIKKEHYDTIHLVTSQALARIASVGGPRCCKRNTMLALEAMVESLIGFFEHTVATEPFVCDHFPRNRECLNKECPYFPRRTK